MYIDSGIAGGFVDRGNNLSNHWDSDCICSESGLYDHGIEYRWICHGDADARGECLASGSDLCGKSVCLEHQYICWYHYSG